MSPLGGCLPRVCVCVYVCLSIVLLPCEGAVEVVGEGAHDFNSGAIVWMCVRVYV